MKLIQCRVSSGQRVPLLVQDGLASFSRNVQALTPEQQKIQELEGKRPVDTS